MSDIRDIITSLDTDTKIILNMIPHTYELLEATVTIHGLVYVNAVAFQPNNSTGRNRLLVGGGVGNVTYTIPISKLFFSSFQSELSRSPGLLASASDDCSLILHRLEVADRRHVITFGSPVMAVKWHPGEEAKLMVKDQALKLFLF